jgi:hypothetical protein
MEGSRPYMPGYGIAADAAALSQRLAAQLATQKDLVPDDPRLAVLVEHNRHDVAHLRGMSVQVSRAACVAAG